jgi:hypothetical protein
MQERAIATNLWGRDWLTDEEVAAAELDALIWWAYAEMAFENYREGLSTENAWREMEVEIKVLSALPAHRAVYDYWYTQVPGEFTRKVDELTRLAAHAANK